MKQRIRFVVVSLAVLLLLNLAGAAMAAVGPNATIQRILQNAVVGERNAEAKYKAFAAKADEEGYTGLASLFRAQAKSEGIHAREFAALLKKRAGEMPAGAPDTPAVYTSRENLRLAVQAEQIERDTTYKDAAEEAKRAGDQEVAARFELSRDSETEHFNLTSDASRNFDKMKKPKTYYVCDHCGYTTDIQLRTCPAGKHGGTMVEVD